MENRLLKSSLLFLLLPCQSISAIEISKHLSTIVEPEPIDRIHPKYPVKAAKENRAGWSKFSFVIEKDGSVSNILELDSSGSKDFSKAAAKAIKRWKYQPALENGEPIQQCVNTVQLDFRMRKGRDVVRKHFKKNYNLALDALNEKKYSRVEELILKMEKFNYRYIAENNLLQTISASYAEAIGNNRKQLKHLSNISFLNDDRKTKKYKLSILSNRFLLAVSLNEFQSAYRAYNKLKDMEEAKPYMTKYDEIITKVDAFIGGEQDIVINADIENKDFWQYSLVRNEFSLANVKGSLNKLDIRCANKRHVYTVENNNTWKLPKTWENCSLFVYGEDNTSFKLIEHPIKS
jgi:TonB family protein